MKILYVDLLSPIGHKNYNYSLLDILSDFNCVDTAFGYNYLSDYKGKLEKIGNVYNIPDKYLPKAVSNKKGLLRKLLHRFNIYRAMKWIESLVDENKYDLVIFSSIEIISFALATRRLKKRYLFVDHAISALEGNGIKKFFWRHINQQAEAVVMEEYIKEYLINKINIKNRIWVVRHPLPKIDINESGFLPSKDKVIFAPSGSNDENFILFLINNIDKIKNYKVIIKSKRLNFKADNLDVYNNRITDEEYYRLMSACDYVLLPYESSYNYRVSGVFFEAVVFNKKCILNGNNTLRYHANDYPGTVTQYKEYEDFFNVLENLTNCDNSEEVKLIKSVYSDESLTTQLKFAFWGQA